MLRRQAGDAASPWFGEGEEEEKMCLQETIANTSLQTSAGTSDTPCSSLSANCCGSVLARCVYLPLQQETPVWMGKFSL